MVAVRGHVRRPGAYIALGVALGLISGDAGAGFACAQPQQRPAQQASTDESKLSDVAIHDDTGRIAAALETRNRYDESVEGQRDAHSAAKSAHDAATWAFWLFVDGALETMVTLAGVVLVALTLNEARKSAREAKRTADATLEANRLSREFARDEQRPWVAVNDIKAYSAPREKAGELEIPLLLHLKNVGKSPAVSVTVKLGHCIGSEPSEVDIQRIQSTCRTRRRFKGASIFPASEAGHRHTVIVSGEDLQKLNVDEIGRICLDIVIIGVVSYKTKSGGSPLYTGFVYRLRDRNGQRWRAAAIAGLALPPGNVDFQAWTEGWFAT